LLAALFVGVRLLEHIALMERHKQARNILFLK